MKLLQASMGTPAPGRPLWPRWVALAVFVVTLVVAFVNLGNWQLDRLDQRRERNESVAEHESAPVRNWDEVFGPVITEADQWQRVRVRGSFDGEHQFVVRYRSQEGRSGYEVLTPLRTADGQPYRLFALPWPRPVVDGGRRLAASYANFLIVNGAVLLPAYDDPADARAAAVLQQAFTGREIVQVPCRPLIWQNGSLHCVTMQLPAGVLA